MKLLLDTHVLIWLGEDDPTIGAAARRRIAEAADADGILVSPVSVFEVGRLAQTGRIALSLPVNAWLALVCGQGQIEEAPVTMAIAEDAALLPGDAHGDPIDRMLIATARCTGSRLATRDRRILSYADGGHVHVLAV